MKNAIKYFYNLDAISIHQKNKIFNFKVNDDSYVLINYAENDISDIFEINKYLITNNLKTNNIILNNQNQLLTNINNENYILIKLIIPQYKISLDDIIIFNNTYININKLNKSNWFDLWTKKVDYLEYQISQIGLKHKLIRESFSYYIGLSEIAICLVKDKTGQYLSLNHKRINYTDDSFMLYNPINYIIDYRFRDVCEYFKSCFFNNIDVSNSIKQYINNLTNDEKVLFYGRLLFPTYYFDCYDCIINNEIEEDELKKIINKVNDYEFLLKDIYDYLGNILPEIEYIKKLSNIDNF